MDFLTWVLVGELTGLFASVLKGKQESNDTLAYMLFGIVGAVVGGKIPTAFGYEGNVTGGNTTIGMAVIGACILIGLEVGLQSWRASQNQR